MSSVEGYPGEKMSLAIPDKYEVYENGARLEKPISRVHIDWGDGTSSTSYAGLNQIHQYGERHEDGDITPEVNTRFTGRVTFHTNDGKNYTEGFDYEVWVDRRGSMGRGGRELSPEPLEPVWCMNGTIESDGRCNSSFEVQQIVFEYEGCFDHNRVRFPVLFAPEATFDVRGTASISGGKYNQGWLVRANSNQIQSLYSSDFRVYAHKGSSNDNNMSGIYYMFNPINPSMPEPGTQVDSITIDSAQIWLNSFKGSYKAALSYGVWQHPTSANNWLGVYRIEDKGVAGGTPPCPVGQRTNEHAWAKLSIGATVKGTVHTVRSTNSASSMPAGHHENEYHNTYLNDPRVTE